MVPAPLKTDMSLQGKRKEQKKAGPMPGLVSSIKTKREQKRLWLRVGATLERGAVVVLGAVHASRGHARRGPTGIKRIAGVKPARRSDYSQSGIRVGGSGVTGCKSFLRVRSEGLASGPLGWLDLRSRRCSFTS